MLMESADMQRQLYLGGERALAHVAVPARMSVHHAYVLCQVAAARERLVAPRAVRHCDWSRDRPPADLRQVLGRLPAMHRRHVVAEQGRRLQHGAALRTAEPVVELPHVERERHAAAEKLRALAAVELDAAVDEVRVLVQVRAVDERFAADVA